MEVRKIPKKTITVTQPTLSNVVNKEKYRQLRVAAYGRVSTDSEEQLTSYTNQIRIYKEIDSRKNRLAIRRNVRRRRNFRHKG